MAAAPSGGAIVPVAGGLVMLVVLALLGRCGTLGDAEPASASTISGLPGATVSGSATFVPETGSSITDTDGGTATTDPGSLTADGQSLLDAAGSPDPAAALADLSGRPVTATDVEVLCVPADEGFWIGTSDSRRIWVQLIGEGESVYQVDPGDTVDLTGILVPHDGSFAGAAGVRDAGAAAQLTSQGQHIDAAMDAVTVSD